MANDLVVSGIKIETAELLKGQRRIESALSQIERSTKGVDRSLDRTGGSFDKLGRRVIAAAGAYLTFRTALRAGRFIVQTNARLQDLQANLQTVTGSAAKAAKAFDDITKFARRTPFEIEGLTEAFVRLQAFGAGPAIEEFQGLGNIAAAFSRDITTLTDAIVSAVNTSIEPIRQFGVQASVTGDKLTVSFQGVTRTIPRTTAALKDFLAEMGNSGQFAGAMERRMNTLGGAFSNLQDSVTLFTQEIGEAGLNRELVRAVKVLDAAIQSGDDLARTLGEGAAGGVRLFAGSLQAALPIVQFWAEQLAKLGDQSIRMAGPRVEAFAGLEKADQVNNLLRKVAEDRNAAFEKLQAAQERLRTIQAEPVRFGNVFTDIFGQGAVEDAEREVARLSEVLRRHEQEMQAGLQRRSMIAEAITPPSSGGGIAGLGESARAARDPIADIMATLAAAEREIAGLMDALRGTSIEFDANAEAARLMGTTVSALLAEGVDPLSNRVQELVGRWAGYTKAVEKAARATAMLEERQKRLQEIQQRHEDRVKGFQKKIQEDERAAELQKALEQMEAQRQMAERIGDTFANSFASIITGTQSVADAFRGMAQQIIADLIRIQIQQSLIKPLMGALFANAAGASAGPAGLALGLFGLPGFAKGGPIASGQPAIVGEKGPELFMPASTGKIVPNHQLGSGSGGGGSHTEIHAPIQPIIQGIDGQSIERVLKQHAPSIARMAVDEIERRGALRNRLRRN